MFDKNSDNFHYQITYNRHRILIPHYCKTSVHYSEAGPSGTSSKCAAMKWAQGQTMSTLLLDLAWKLEMDSNALGAWERPLGKVDEPASMSVFSFSRSSSTELPSISAKRLSSASLKNCSKRTCQLTICSPGALYIHDLRLLCLCLTIAEHSSVSFCSNTGTITRNPFGSFSECASKQHAGNTEVPQVHTPLAGQQRLPPPPACSTFCSMRAKAATEEFEEDLRPPTKPAISSFSIFVACQECSTISYV